MELTVLALSFTLLLILGVPVAFAIGLSSVATIIAAGLPVAMVFQKWSAACRCSPSWRFRFLFLRAS